MNRVTVLRQLCLSHPRTAKTIARRGGDAEGIRRLLDDASAMESFLLFSARLSSEEINGLVSPHLTETPPEPATENDVMTVEAVAKYG